jgi:hypothetical protein
MNNLKRVFYAVGFLGLIACASTQASKELDNRIANEKPLQTPGEIAIQGAKNFSETPGLSENQRLELLRINRETAEQAHAIQAQIGQTKSVLFEVLAKPQYKKSEVEYLKNKLSKLDKKRLNLMFQSLDKVEKVLGRSSVDKKNLYEDMYLKEHQVF